MASDDLEELVQPFTTVEAVIILPITTLSSLFLVYGIYTIVFGLSIHVLCRRNSSSSHLYLICNISLFVLANIYTATTAYYFIRQAIIEFTASRTREYDELWNYLRVDDGQTLYTGISNLASNLMKYVNSQLLLHTLLTIFIMQLSKINSIIADITIIHRCWILWGFNKAVLYILGSLSVLVNGLALVGSILITIEFAIPFDVSDAFLNADSRVYEASWIAVAVFNLLLSLLTAGRIWWVSHQARRQLGRSVRGRYKEIVAIILESGLLYPATLVAAGIVSLTVDPEFQGLVPFDPSVIGHLMAGLAPTLIIVRVAYGKSVDNVDQVMSIHFADRGAGHTTINIVPRSQDDNTEPTDGGEEKMGDVPRRMV